MTSAGLEGPAARAEDGDGANVVASAALAPGVTAGLDGMTAPTAPTARVDLGPPGVRAFGLAFAGAATSWAWT